MAKVTIFGLAGTGTSTVGRAVAERLRVRFVSTGDIFRQKAREMNSSLGDFERRCNNDPSYDLEIDKEIARIGKLPGGLIVESRLAWHFIPDSFKVKLHAEFAERIKRVAARDGISFAQAEAETKFRETAALERYKRCYGLLGFPEDRDFDLVIDTTKAPILGVVEKIISTTAHFYA